jgi:hypothetical protein
MSSVEPNEPNRSSPSLDERILSLTGRPTVRWVGGLVGISLFSFVAFKAWSGLEEVLRAQHASLAMLGLSLAVMMLGEVVVGIGFARATSLYGSPMPVLSGVLVHVKTAPARVLPGAVGAAAGRVLLGGRLGIQPGALVAGSVFEPVASALTACVLGAVFLRGSVQQILSSVDRPWRELIVILAVSLPVGVSALAALNERFRARWFRSPLKTLGAFGTYALAWLIFGTALHTLVVAIGVGSPGVGVTAAAFSLSWLLGFAVVFIPAGLGVREGVLALVLSDSLGIEVATLVAVLSRVIWWAATAALFVIGVVIGRLNVKDG